MKRTASFLILGAAFLASGCKTYLSEEPKKQTTIQTADQLEELEDNATLYTYETDYTVGYSTDDTEITQDQYKNNSNKFTLDYIYYYVFNVDQIAGAAADALWNGEYKNIFTANLILSQVDKVTGDDATKTRVKADAYFLRAYSYWVLANHYCLPYTKDNAGIPGLPLKKTVDYEESLGRATLKETYDFILSDIAEAQKLAPAEVNPKKTWRVSQKAIEAFLSRYYLFLGDYDNSLAHANNALGSSAVALMDYKTIKPGNPATYTNPAATLNYSELNDWAPVKFLYWPEFYYARFSYIATQWFVPSASLIALYDKSNDLRYKYFMIENGGRRLSVITPAMYRYDMFYDGRYLPVGPTLAEVLLNKAEVLARKGDITNAMAAVNTLRDKRMATAAPLSASDQNDAIKKVLEERRREFPFSMRWYDIRRFSVNGYNEDDVVVTRNFFKVNIGSVDVNTPQTYTLSLGSRRYAIPINGVEID
ncbi:MAG: RagB/SusD family nutrient uptake outer membrane protein, partial [Bacteroidetes bacterium]|nr:RagB/SusD family nutrient uptake outer membrane protein [Bacteroidota bacterium]